MAESVDRSELADEELIEQGTETEGASETGAMPSGGGLRQNPLFSTEPSVPISEIEHEHECPKWAAYLIRMGYKITGSHGTPAIVDGGFGAILGYQNLQADKDSSGGEVETVEEETAVDGVSEE